MVPPPFKDCKKPLYRLSRRFAYNGPHDPSQSRSGPTIMGRTGTRQSDSGLLVARTAREGGRRVAPAATSLSSPHGLCSTVGFGRYQRTQYIHASNESSSLSLDGIFGISSLVSIFRKAWLLKLKNRVKLRAS